MVAVASDDCGGEGTGCASIQEKSQLQKPTATARRKNDSPYPKPLAPEVKSRYVHFAIVLVCGWLASGVTANDATLFWTNGDSLKGTLVGSDGKSLTWQSTLFADPLQIELSSLATVTYPKVEPTKVPDSEFCILLRNGDVLSGNLKALDAETVTFEGVRFGTFQIARSKIVSLQRSANYGLIYLGPRGLDGWQMVGKQSSSSGYVAPPRVAVRADPFGGDEPAVQKKKASSWSEGPDGSIQTLRPDADLFLSKPLPEKFAVEVELQSKKTCSFSMVIGRDAKSGLRVETWVDVLVAVNNVQFVPLRNLGEEDHNLHLYVFVDFSVGEMSVYSPSGQKLGKIELKSRGTSVPGLTFRCLENDLTIRRLRISQWDGSTPRFFASANDARIQLADGKTHFGTLQKFNAESGAIVMREENADIEVSLANVSSIYMSAEQASRESDRGASHLAWNDGSFASGTLQSIVDGVATVATTYTKEPLRCAMTDANRIALTGTTTKPDLADRLFHPGGSLSGSLVVDGESDAPIRWKPLGGLNASTLKTSSDVRFLRGASVTHFSSQPELLAAYPDVVYLANNDVLPCRFEGCSEETIQLTSPFAAVRSLAKQNVRAVELGAASRIHQSGFGADGWKGITNKEKVVIRSNTNCSHPSILTGDTIRFRLSWPEQSYASLILSLYGTGEPTDPETTVVTFSILQNLVQVLDRPPPPQNQFVIRRMGQPDQDGIGRVPDSAADIQIVARDGNLLVSVNGKQIKTINVKPAGAGSRALGFSASGMMNRRMVVNGRVQSESGVGVEVSQFEIDNLAGVSIRHFIEDESRQTALTIPRFRRDHPPTHVLLAPNGDLLRGHLLGINDQQVTFESRLETLRLDRQRVAAIVWLHSDKKAPMSDATAAQPGDSKNRVASAEGGKSTMLANLADGFNITMSPQRLVDGQLHGHSALLGNCHFPAATIRELIVGNSASSQLTAAYDRWIAQHAKEPDWDIPQSDGGNSAANAMIGQVADDFQLPLLDGTTFRLKDHSDKIVVLDFWATWCGPCVAALPDYIRATSEFDASKVIFVAVNLQESSDQIRSFLSERSLSPQVALDRSADISRKFQVTGIPHTVILGPGNVVEEVHIGYQPGTGDALQTTIKQMLDGTWKRPEKSSNAKPQAPAPAP